MLSGGSADLEVVIVGAGAAGLGAATRLGAARVSFTVLEARGRGRQAAYAFADAPFPLDLGCGWQHSAERNPWTQIAAEAGDFIGKPRRSAWPVVGVPSMTRPPRVLPSVFR